MLLVGDMGGTKTVLAVFSPDSGPHKPQFETRYPSAHYPSLEAIIQEFLEKINLPIEGACFWGGWADLWGEGAHYQHFLGDR